MVSRYILSANDFTPHNRHSLLSRSLMGYWTRCIKTANIFLLSITCIKSNAKKWCLIIQEIWCGFLTVFNVWSELYLETFSIDATYKAAYFLNVLVWKRVRLNPSNPLSLCLYVYVCVFVCVCVCVYLCMCMYVCYVLCRIFVALKELCQWLLKYLVVEKKQRLKCSQKRLNY